jgi:DNA polymerase III epsilon subunit family exonuclease
VSGWIDRPLIGIDTETTGLSVVEDRVFEVALVTFQGGEVIDSFSELIDPQQTLNDIVVSKTGVQPQELVGRPTFAQYAQDLAARMADQVLVGYNLLDFDLPILQAELARVGLRLPRCWAIDGLVLARGLVQGGRHSLSDMAVRFGVEMETAHRATADAEATVRVLLKMAPDLPADLDELVQLQAHWRDEQRARRAMWRQRSGDAQPQGASLLGTDVGGTARLVDDQGRVVLGPGYLYGRERDPLRAFIAAYCNQAIDPKS